MSLHTSLFVVLVAFASLALCDEVSLKKGGPGGHFIHGPTYLSNLTKEEKAEYFGIFRDHSLTIKQQEAKKLAFAEKHGFAQTIKDDEKVKVANQQKIFKERPELIKILQEANDQLGKIYDNKDQTVAQQQAAVEALKEKYPHAVPTLYYMSRLITGTRHKNTKPAKH